LQAPGVSQDSAASGLLHVRNDHANVQYRINGILLPDGVTGFGSIFDSSFIGSMALVTGALPAEYGLRTVGLVDITTRSDLFNNSGSVSMYGGSHGTIQPSFEYGGTFGSTCPATTTSSTYVKALPANSNCFPGVQYFFSGNYLQNTVGLENPTPAYNAIHDFTQQERGFAYMSAFIDPTTRISLIAGTSNNSFEIPNNPGQPIGQSGVPVTNAFGATSFNSALLNENQSEFTQFGVLTVQKSYEDFNGQLSYFTRYSKLQFTPDPTGDLLINGIASTVTAAPTRTASRATAPISSIRPIRSALASPSAASRCSSVIRRWSSPAWFATALTTATLLASPTTSNRRGQKPGPPPGFGPPSYLWQYGGAAQSSVGVPALISFHNVGFGMAAWGDPNVGPNRRVAARASP
jgi:hypothetical protein